MMIQNINNDEIAFEEEEIVGVSLDLFNKYDGEKIIHHFSQVEVSIILLKYLGYHPQEIVDFLNLKNVRRYYDLNQRIAKYCRRAKNLRIL